jgi:hypothetical protein
MWLAILVTSLKFAMRKRKSLIDTAVPCGDAGPCAQSLLPECSMDDPLLIISVHYSNELLKMTKREEKRKSQRKFARKSGTREKTSKERDRAAQKESHRCRYR